MIVRRLFAALKRWIRRRGGIGRPSRLSRPSRPLALLPLVLERRDAPAVTSVAFLAITPTPARPDAILITGVVGDTHDDAPTTANLTADYRVRDAQGRVRDSGAIELTPIAGGSNASFAFRVPTNATRGEHTIEITARDRDDIAAGRDVRARAALLVDPDPVPNQSNIAFASSGEGGAFQGGGQGRFAFRKTPQGALALMGQGDFRMTGESDVGRLRASGRGHLAFRADPVGAVLTGASGRTEFQVVDSALESLMNTELQGRFAARRGPDTSLSLRAQGGFKPTADSPLGHVEGGGQGEIALRSDGQGHFRLRLDGHLNIQGDLPDPR